MGLSDHGEDLALDLLLENATYYIALCYSLPSDSDDGSDLDEVSGGGYARQTIAPAGWDAADGGIKSNSAVIQFSTATADWGTTTVKYFAICTASTGGNVVASGPLGSARRVYEGYTPFFPAGSITCVAN